MVLSRWLAVALAGTLALGTWAFAKEKDKPEGARSVDSGSFGVFKNGQRIATENFSIQDSSNGKVIAAQFKTEGGSEPNSQSSELRLSAGGDLVRYQWRELVPGKSELTVVPNDQFLLERITNGPSDKPAEQPFLMPTSTMVLDNNSFVQREVLAWKYLAANCARQGTAFKCSQAPAQFGVIIPQERISMSVTMELVGKEKVRINNTDRELMRLNLKDDIGQWAIWVDDQNMFKLMRIIVAGDNTEILRD
ncbi:MAG TPA: hypothetical protein VFA89_12945 [Terriglobales bacterium]|nr:hypothetical protein [Terriglobales bacterium]